MPTNAPNTTRSSSSQTETFTSPPTSPHHSAALSRDELIEQNIVLVGHIARQLGARLPAHVEQSDLISAGMAGLVQAADAFDPAREIPFPRYASTRIKGAMLDDLRSSDWAPRGVRRQAREVEQARGVLAAALGRTPEVHEIAEALGISTDVVLDNERDVARSRVVSLHGPSEVPMEDILPSMTPGPEQILEHRERLTMMMEAVDELPDRLRHVVIEYYLNERPMAEIGAEMGVTESRVSQMCTDALGRVREAVYRATDPELAAPVGTGCAARRRERYFDAVAARFAGAQ